MAKKTRGQPLGADKSQPRKGEVMELVQCYGHWVLPETAVGMRFMGSDFARYNDYSYPGWLPDMVKASRAHIRKLRKQGVKFVKKKPEGKKA